MILAGLMGSLAASSGGGTKTITQNSIAYGTIQEGQQQSITVDLVNWNNTNVYWTITNSGGTELTSQVTPSSGVFNSGYGNDPHTISFTFNADATTEGSLNYYVHFSSSPGYNDYLNIGPLICRDSSQTNALVLDLDPANLDLFWTDTSGQSNNASYTGIVTSADNGGVFIFNGESSYANVPTLTNSIYGSVTVSAWIKPSAINRTQTIVSKELCYKLNITSDGRIAWMVGSADDSSWSTTIYSGYGLISAGAWSHIMATVDYYGTRIYINGYLAQNSTGVILVGNNYRFGIGAYDAGQSGFGDFFGGRFGEVKMWNYAVNDNAAVVGEYNSSAARYGLTPIPLSLDFPGSGNPWLTVSNNQSDWNLGSTYTIEFWSKSTTASTGTIRTIMSQNPGNTNIDLGYIEDHLLWSNVKQGSLLEPTPGQWTHVAIVRDGGAYASVFYNGVGIYSFGYATLTNGTGDLAIGRRGPSNSFQYFVGQLALIRISNTAKYSVDFDPSFSYGVEADTRLMLGKDNPLVDTSIYELNGIATSQGNGSTIYFSKSTYPYLDIQVQAGDTVVDADTLASTTVTGAVYTADPDNWGINILPSQAGGTKNFSRTGRHPITTNGNVSVSVDFPAFQSLEFNQPQGDYLMSPAYADWNLGVNWTIEFWMNANNSSNSGIHIPGGQWGLLNQGGWFSKDNSILIGLADNKFLVGQSTGADLAFTEPTPGQWTHVAVVANSGDSTQKVFYNGVEQTSVRGSYLGNALTNTTDALYIGRLAPIYESHFDGKMAMVRISNTAKYLTTFSATTTYGVEADTKLFLNKLNPLVDSMSHTITNNGVTTSNSFPS